MALVLVFCIGTPPRLSQASDHPYQPRAKASCDLGTCVCVVVCVACVLNAHLASRFQAPSIEFAPTWPLSCHWGRREPSCFVRFKVREQPQKNTKRHTATRAGSGMCCWRPYTFKGQLHGLAERTYGVGLEGLNGCASTRRFQRAWKVVWWTLDTGAFVGFMVWTPFRKGPFRHGFHGNVDREDNW